MKLVYDLCSKLAVSLNLTEEQQEIIIFGAESAISTLYSFGLAVALSLVLGVLPIMLMIYIPFALMKTFAGGAHCKTMTNCAVFSALSFTSCAKLVELYPVFFTSNEGYVLVFTIVISLLFYIFWAPAQVPEKPISREYGLVLRKRTFICFGILITIMSLFHLLQVSFAYPLIGASCVGIMMQSLAITPLGYKLMGSIDFILTRILQGRCNCEKG